MEIIDKKILDAFERDTASAESLPAELYTSQEVYDQELERIFYRKWLCLCREEDLSKPGDVLVHKVGYRPIVVARDRGGKLNAFYNVCRHRGARILRDSCNTTVFQCPYHGWTYGLDGRLVGAPDMDDTMGFDKEDYPLYPVKLERWGGFVWINLDPDSESLVSYLGDLPERFGRYHLEDMVRVSTIGNYEIAGNWKVYQENANECYHCVIVHPQMQQMQPYRKFVWTEFGSGLEKVRGPYSTYYYEGPEENVRGVWGRPTEAGSGKPSIEGLAKEDLNRAYAVQLFPNLIMNFTPDYALAITVWPEGPNKTRSIASLLFPRSLVEQKSDPTPINEAIDLVNRQDVEIVEEVQAGLLSGVYTPGRYSTLEVPVHKFQKLYVENMKLVA